MAVIIDTFEVISDADTKQASAPGNGATQSAPGEKLKPVDIQAVLLHQTLRNDRLRAH